VPVVGIGFWYVDPGTYNSAAEAAAEIYEILYEAVAWALLVVLTLWAALGIYARYKKV
jgi:phosphatidylglycerophosphatase A